MNDDPTLYRTVIDALVVQCREGQGQVSARRILAGVWNENAELVDDVEPAQHDMNILLDSLSPQQREVLSKLFAEEFQSGVYNVLQVLELAHIMPFEAGIGGSASDNFLDRLDDWNWPEDPFEASMP